MIAYSIGKFTDEACYFRIDSGDWEGTVFAVSSPRFKKNGNLSFKLLELDTPLDVDIKKLPAMLLDDIKEILMDYTSLLYENNNLKLKE